MNLEFQAAVSKFDLERTYQIGGLDPGLPDLPYY
jgi:hypothetical protein